MILQMNQTYPYVDLWPGFKNLILSLEQYILNKDNKINAGNSSEGLEGNAKNSLEGLEIGATDTERDQSILQQKILYKNRNMDTIAPIFCKLITVIFKFRSQIPSSFSSIWLNHDFCFSFSFDRTLFFTLKSVVLIILFKKIKSIIILPDLRFLNRN
uniref:Uncharacterized protein n=1 Tax=Rhizophagus irregularis (strain DAOM 181602 / DAOM 197198 / MUCL 43194) TaxID=747089 RepID=U9UXH7_RHIID